MDQLQKAEQSVYKQHAKLRPTVTLGKVISNYPPPTIDSILAHLNSCKYFLTYWFKVGLLSYQTKWRCGRTRQHLWLTRVSGFFTCYLSVLILVSSAFSYILGKVLTQCSEYALSYLDNIMGLLWDMGEPLRASWRGIQMAKRCRFEN